MQVSVVVSDNVVVVDGMALHLQNLELDSAIHAIQWSGDSGEVEYTDGRHDVINDISLLTPLIEAHAAELARIQAEEQRIAARDDHPLISLGINNDIEPETLWRRLRDILLNEALTELDRYQKQTLFGGTGTLTEPQAQEWASYAQALRDLPQQIGFSDAVTLPDRPVFPAVDAGGKVEMVLGWAEEAD